METLFIVIILILLAMLVAVSLSCLRLYGKKTALEKENAMHAEQHERLLESLEKNSDELHTMRSLREEQFARIAVLESENGVCVEV